MASTRTADTGAEIRPIELWLPNGAGDPQKMNAADGNAGFLGGALPFVLHVANGGVFAPVLGPADGRTSTQVVGATPMVQTGAGAFDPVRDAVIFKDFAATAIVAGTPATIWTPAAGKRFRLLGFMLSSSVATSVVFKYGAANTTLFRTPILAVNTPLWLERLGNGAMPGAASDPLKLDVLANATVTAVAWGTEE